MKNRFHLHKTGANYYEYDENECFINKF